MNGLNNVFKIARINIQHFQLPYFIVALLFTGAMVALFGVVELSELAVNTVFGRFLPLLGFVLLSPLVISELNEEISAVIYTKKTAHWQVVGLRMMISLLVIILILVSYVGILIANDSVVGIVQLRDSLINVVFLGSLGFLSIILFKNVVTGYMAAIIYYLSNFFIPKEMGMFYLFDMTINKLPLLLCAIACLGIGMYWNEKQK